VQVEVVAAVDDPVMTVGIIVGSEVVNVGIPGNAPAVTLPLLFQNPSS